MATINISQKKKLKKVFLQETNLFQLCYIQKHPKIIFPDQFSVFGTERVNHFLFY